MKTIKNILTFFLFFFTSLPIAALSADPGELRLSLIEGDVQLWSVETNDWIPVTINMPLYEGDRLWLPQGGKAEVQIRNGSFVRLNENTSLEILRVDTNSLQTYLSEGQAYVNFTGIDNTMIQLDTPFSSTRVYAATKFLVNVNRTGETDISVLNGEVFVDSSQGNTKLNTGQKFSIGDKYANISPLDRQDSWEQWNRDRDWKIADRRYQSDYLPDELRPYASDFDAYGRWVNDREYGYVWTPTVSVTAGWSPYNQGRWIWRGGDYVWISYEPWGWAPYHYGRWAHISSVGWCWVPPQRGAVYWGPGYVGWVSTPNYVAWVPLAPREVYYGYGNYGPYSMNIININVHRDFPRHSYRNLRARNAVTVIHHDTFLHGRHRDVKVKENPFLKNVPSVGRPTIRPAKETYAPVHRDIPESRRPPEHVRRIKVKTIQEERPLVKERGSRVMKSESFEKSGREWKREREIPNDTEMQRQKTKNLGEPQKQRGAVKANEKNAPPVVRQKEQVRKDQRSGDDTISRTPDYPADQQMKQGESRSKDQDSRRQREKEVKRGPAPEQPDTIVDTPHNLDKANRRSPERREKAPSPVVVQPSTGNEPAPHVRGDDNQGRGSVRGEREPSWNNRPQQRETKRDRPEVGRQPNRERTPEVVIPAPAPPPGQERQQTPQPGYDDQKRGKQKQGKEKKTEDSENELENPLLNREEQPQPFNDGLQRRQQRRF